MVDDEHHSLLAWSNPSKNLKLFHYLLIQLTLFVENSLANDDKALVPNSNGTPTEE